jgi:predicted transposase/invertase (TIGR01784 family)
MNDEIVSPLYDFAFSQIFGTQRNIANTRAFLKALLDIPESDYDRLTVVSPFLKRRFRHDKMGIVDLKLSTKSGRVIHIELQVDKEADMRSRIMYYAARLLSDQLNWGENYGELRQVISIVICDHVLLDEEKSYINAYEMRNRGSKSFTNLIQIVILELPKLPETGDSGVWPWLKFFTCKSKEEFEMLANDYPELKEAVYCAKRMSLRKWVRQLLFEIQIRQMDRRAIEKQRQIDLAESLAKGLEEGRAEGHAEGHAEEKYAIAKKLKDRGRPLSEIAEDTGLSVEEVEKL